MRVTSLILFYFLSGPNIGESFECRLQFQVIIAQWLAQHLATSEVLGSNPCKGENFLNSDKKGNLNNSNHTVGL